MPAWVVDYVLLHELAHLLETGHTPTFWRLVERYPRAERARGFLEGMALASGLEASTASRARASSTSSRSDGSSLGSSDAGHHATSSDSVADRDLRAGRRHGEEPYVEVARDGEVAAERHLVGVELQRVRVQLEGRHARLLGGLPERGGRQPGVLRLEVTPEVEPAVGLGVQGEQHAVTDGVEDQRATGEVTRDAAPAGAVGVDLQVLDVLPAEGGRAGVGGTHDRRTARASRCWAGRVTPAGSALLAALVLGVAGLAGLVVPVLLGRPAVQQLGERRVEVVAELAARVELGLLAEAQRVVEVGRGRQQVGVRPDRVAAPAPLRLAERCPTAPTASRSRRGRSSSPTSAANVGLGGPAGGAAAADGLLQLRGARHPTCGGLADDLVDPALDERERGLEPDERGLLGRASSRGSNSPLVERLLQRGGVRSGRSPAIGSSMREMSIVVPRP